MTDEDLERRGAPTFDSARLKQVMGHFCTGVTVITAIDDGEPVGFTAQSFQSLSLDSVADSVLELCEGVDLLIHDAQYTREEFAEKAHWGHCTVDYAVLVAKEARVRRLAMFHHDPSHDDDFVDVLLEQATCLGALAGLHEVIAASEGLSLQL